jgi:hypothetical protein
MAILRFQEELVLRRLTAVQERSNPGCKTWVKCNLKFPSSWKLNVVVSVKLSWKY